MHQASHAVGEQHVDLRRFDQSSHLALTKRWMKHRLPGAISARLIVGSAWVELASRAGCRAGLEGSDGATLGTGDAGNLATLRERRDNMTAFLATLDAHFFHSITNHKSRLLYAFVNCFHFLLFHDCYSFTSICNDTLCGLGSNHMATFPR